MNYEKTEEQILNKLKEINPTVFIIWFSDAEIRVSDNCKKVQIITDSLFRAHTIEAVFYKDIEKAAAAAIGFLPEIDYRFRDQDGKELSVLEGKTRQSILDKGRETLEQIIMSVLEDSTDDTVLYIVPDLKSCVLTIEDGAATLDFTDPLLLKVAGKYCKSALEKALNTLLDTEGMTLEFTLNSNKFNTDE